jgi:hypothetical protein
MSDKWRRKDRVQENAPRHQGKGSRFRDDHIGDPDESDHFHVPTEAKHATVGGAKNDEPKEVTEKRARAAVVRCRPGTYKVAERTITVKAVRGPRQFVVECPGWESVPAYLLFANQIELAKLTSGEKICYIAPNRTQHC